ncbi:MAG: hypothetical protein ACR2MX_19675 [Cyclobacteriaceae bacterium]
MTDQEISAQIKERVAKGDAKFLSSWGKARTNKWRYVLLHGVVFYTLPMALVIYLISIRFDFNAFNWAHFLTSCLIISLFGVIWQLWVYQTREKHYKKIKETSQ